MVDQQELADCGVAAGDRDQGFDAIARIAARAVSATAAAIAFGDPPHIVGYSRPGAPAAQLVPAALHADVLASGLPATAADALAVPVRAPSGNVLGTLVARAGEPRVWSADDLAAIADVARSASTALALRSARRPDVDVTRIIDAISDALVFLDRDWRYTYVNQKAAAIFGRDVHDMIGKHVWTEFPEGVSQPFYASYQRAVAEQQMATIEAFYPPWNRWFENRIYPSSAGLLIVFQDITEARRHELERRRLAAILEVTPDVVAMAGNDGKLTFLNEAGRKQLGAVEPVLGSVLAMHAPSAKQMIADHAIPTALRDGVWRGESALATVHGPAPVLEVLLWQQAAAPDGSFLAVVAHDISEQKRAEQELRKAAEIRAQAERMAHLGFWQWHIATNHVTWSDELYRIYGVSSDHHDPSFDGYMERIHPADRARIRSMLESALAGGGAMTFDERIIRPDGQIRHLHSWGKVTVDDTGRPVEMFGACLDMTALIETTEGLRRTEEWLSLALDGARMGLWDWHVDRDRLSWSHDDQLVLGVTPGTLGDSLPDYLAHVVASDRAAVAAAFHAATAGRPLELEHRIRLPDGGIRWIALSGRMFPDAGGRPVRVAGSAVDVTDRRGAEEEQRRIAEQLRHAQKMEAIGRLAAGVAHDLNNLLTVISGSTQLLSTPRSRSDDDHVELIMTATDRAATLTRQLLALSRQQVFELTCLDVNAVVTEMSGLLQRLFPPSIELRTELSTDHARIRADRSQLEQVVLNLAVNARDAMPAGGVLTIRTRADGDDIVLEVSDTGVGMDTELQARIFEPFFTTKGEGQGTGLGLATVYGIVAQSGGQVTVTSAPGAGSTFLVRLPALAASAAPEAATPAPSPRAPPHSGGETILLVEDDGAVRAVVAAILEDQRYRVIPVPDAESALAAVAHASRPIDLLLADVHLPQMSGIELARRIRAQHTGMKVLFMSGRREDGSADLPGPIVEKPFGVETLTTRVRRALEEPG